MTRRDTWIRLKNKLNHEKIVTKGYYRNDMLGFSAIVHVWFDYCRDDDL